MSEDSPKFDWVIIDGDPLIYRCGFSIEKRNKETEVLEVEPMHHAYYNINSMMNKILDLSKDRKYKVFLTAEGDKTNFRFSIFPQYKANRKDARKPVYYKELREYMTTKWNAEVVTGIEADDRCSIEQYTFNALGFDETSFNSIVCSFDKDFNNIPGWHYNYVKDNIYYITALNAYKNFVLQILTGDTSDGIPRIKKGWLQKKAAEAILEATNTDDLLEIAIAEAMKVLGLSSIDAGEWLIDRGRLVHLQRFEDEMWSPSDSLILKS